MHAHMPNYFYPVKNFTHFEHKYLISKDKDSVEM